MTSAVPRSSATGPLAVALFAIGLLLAGLVVLALLWSGTGPYADMARDNGAATTVFIAPGGREVAWDLPATLELHRRWSEYVTGVADVPPTFEGDVRFTGNEYSHMADVRRVFDIAKLLVPAGLFVILVRLQRARAHSGASALRLARAGSLAAAAVVALVGILALAAFESLFMAFHVVVFPQGNYMFDPATSNLIRLYPDWYWEGITQRVGVSFVAVALGVALAATLALRRAK